MSADHFSINKNYSENIQLLRGIAIISVVFIHATPDGMTTVLIRPFLNFSVELFLFLSGFLSRENSNRFKRVKKILLPFLIWTLIYVIMLNYKNLSAVPLEYLKNIITTKCAPMLYFVYVYCELTLLIPLIEKLSKSKLYMLGFLISPIEIVCMRMLPLILGYELNEFITLLMHVSCIGWFTFFYLGYLFGNKRIELNVSVYKLIAALFIFILVQIIEGYWYFSLGEVDCGTQLKISAHLTAIIYVLLAYKFICSDNRMSMKSLKILGDKSFGIFFSHIAIMRVLGKLPYFKDIAIYPLNAVITILFCLVFVFIGGKLLGRFAACFAL